MENFIEIYDNILPKSLENDVENTCKFTTRLPFYYNDDITGSDLNQTFPGVGHSFIDAYGTTSSFHSYFYQVLNHFCVKRNIIIHNIINGRLFLTFPNLSQEPCHIHTDFSEPHWVCIYYINDSTGDTVFYDNDKNEIKRVSPKKGRIVFFDGKLLHSGTFPTQHPRFIINFNFIGQFFDI